MGDQQLSVGEKVHLAPLDGIGSPDVVEYRGQVGERAVVIGPDRIQFMVAAERVSRIPAVGEEATIRERVAVLRAGREPRPTVTGGQWGEFMACLVNAGSFAGQASTAAANGDNAHSLDCFANAFGALAEAEAML